MSEQIQKPKVIAFPEKPKPPQPRDSVPLMMASEINWGYQDRGKP